MRGDDFSHKLLLYHNDFFTVVERECNFFIEGESIYFFFSCDFLSLGMCHTCQEDYHDSFSEKSCFPWS